MESRGKQFSARECLPTTEEELNQAAAATPKKTVTPTHYSCICNWEHCQEIQQKLYQNLPEHHVWNKLHSNSS